MRTQFSGVLRTHSMLGPPQPRIMWALIQLSMSDGIKPGQDTQCEIDQDTTLCIEVPLATSADTTVVLVDKLARQPRLYFEPVQDPAVDDDGYVIDGMHYCRTPQLGTFTEQTNAARNIVVNEDVLRSIMVHGDDIEDALDVTISGPWNRMLESAHMTMVSYAPEECFTTSTPSGPDSVNDNSTADNADLGEMEAVNVLQLYPRRAAM